MVRADDEASVYVDLQITMRKAYELSNTSGESVLSGTEPAFASQVIYQSSYQART